MPSLSVTVCEMFKKSGPDFSCHLVRRPDRPLGNLKAVRLSGGVRTACRSISVEKMIIGEWQRDEAAREGSVVGVSGDNCDIY